MVVKVHCGTVLWDEFAAMLKMRPQKQSHNALWQPSRPGLPRNLKVANRSATSRKHNEIISRNKAWAKLTQLTGLAHLI